MHPTHQDRLQRTQKDNLVENQRNMDSECPRFTNSRVEERNTPFIKETPGLQLTARVLDLGVKDSWDTISSCS